MNPSYAAAAAAAIRLLALAAATGAAGDAAAAPNLAGMTAMTVEQRPDPSGGNGTTIDTDSTTILSVAGSQLALQHSSLMTRVDRTVLRRVVSRVAVPLGAVILQRDGDGLHFTCNGGAACIRWVHTDFYDAGGASFGDSGDTATYGVIMDADDQARFLAALCPRTHCG